MSKPAYHCEFRAELFRHSVPGGWVFAVVPQEHAPTVTVGWGRTPVRATVDGKTWDTSVWRGKSGQTLLAVPKKIRGDKDHQDVVSIRIEYGIEYRS
jgi:hypothetical protein